MKAGEFIWSKFPYDEDPLKPGPEEHLAYIVEVRRSVGGEVVLDCLYTTSQAWTRSERPPFWIIPIRDNEARALDQRPFVIDASRPARLRLSPAYFPRLDEPGRGVLPKRANDRLQDLILNALAEVAKRPELVVRIAQAPSRRGSSANTKKPPGNDGPGR